MAPWKTRTAKKDAEDFWQEKCHGDAKNKIQWVISGLGGLTVSLAAWFEAIFAPRI